MLGISPNTEKSLHATEPLPKLCTLAPWLLLPSGCAALIYQVTWVRLLGLSMGSTSAAVSTILTAFFLGIGLGSYFAEKISRSKQEHSKQTGLSTFALLELLIGLSGLALLPVFLHLDHLMALLGTSGSLLAVKFAISLVLLVSPTVCMGATFPVLAATLVDQQNTMGSGLSRLYTLNTTGAVFGALLSGFVLLPRLGLDGAIYFAFALNLSATLAALYLRKIATGGKRDDSTSEHQTSPLIPAEHPSAKHKAVALVLFSTGFIAIASEVAWTKYLSIFIGATIYGFAAILGIFLSGIALGSWATKKSLQRSISASSTVAWALIALAAALLFARVGLAQLPEVINRLNDLTEYRQTLKYASVFIVLFPATFIFGALFPVTLAMYCAQVINLPQRVGRGYAINTAGAILGSIAAGFWLIPHFGTDALLTATVVLTIALSWLLVPKSAPQVSTALVATTILLIATWQWSHLDYAKLIASNPYRFDLDAMAGKSPRFLFLEEGKAGVISVVTYDEQKARLQNNGIQESYLPLTAGIAPPFTETLLGLMPYLLHPAPTSAFVVGYGGGNTLQALAHTPLEHIRVVELEPAVISAVAAASGGEIALLQDPRIELTLNDARNTLLVEGRRYDLIVSQPSHPWLAGAGNLFTKQFFAISDRSLNADGVFAQWVNLFNMDATTLRSILQAFYEVFPHGFTLANTRSGDLLLLGSRQTIIFDYRQLEQRMSAAAIRQALAHAEVERPEHLLWYFSLSRDQALLAAQGIEANTDTRIISEVRLAGMTADPQGEESPYKLLDAHTSLDILPYLKPDEAEDFLYLAGRYFYINHATTRTRQALARLEAINPSMAKNLQQNWDEWRASLRQQQLR